ALLSPVLFFEGHAETAQSFLLLRLLHGFLMSGIMPAAYAMAVRETEPEQRGQAIGTVFMGLVLAHGLGSALGGPLLNVFGFRTLFHLIGGLCLLLALLVIRMVIKGKRMDRVAEG
ncbi:MAG TPA: MFS transporter, partial [Planctomycetota bacterium]|nr:MFS transporter [Planctomycetota bacterium]